MQLNSVWAAMALSMLLGAAQVLGFAPLSWWWLSLPLLLWWLWQQLEASPKQAALQAWCLGFGLYLAGVSWVYVSVHVYGGAPAWLAVGLALLLAAYLGAYLALAMYLAWVLTGSKVQRLLLALPAAWFLSELLRGLVFGGFSWLAMGYQLSLTPGVDRWLALIGIPGLGLMLWLLLGLVLVLARRPLVLGAIVVSFTLFSAMLPRATAWTAAEGRALQVGLVQGNIPQDQKWKPQNLWPTMQLYAELTQSLAGEDLVVWPEVAIPASRYRVEEYFLAREREAVAQAQTVLAGVITRRDGHAYNTVYALGQQPGMYVKQHLVPFGEYFPVPDWVRPVFDWLNVPFSDIRTDLEGDPLLYASGVPLLMSICFEDVFPDEFAARAAESQILINVTNDAWFAGTLAPAQHLQIARARAAENGRPLIRVANTGISAFIGPRGELRSQLGLGQRGTLSAAVQPRSGQTPYMRWRDWPLSLISGLVLLVLLIVKMRASPTSQP